MQITDPRLRGADCKSAPAALNIIGGYPQELGFKRFFGQVMYGIVKGHGLQTRIWASADLQSAL
jgi:hypothetical protein